MYKKAVITNKIIEIYEYEKLNVNAKGGCREKTTGEQEEENYKTRQRYRRNAVRRLASANFNNDSKFITLTFRENEQDITKANMELRKFMRKLRGLHCDLKYLAVLEFQKRGAIHYHCMLNIPYIRAKDIELMWGNGFIKINKIEHVDNVGAYITEYMSDDVGDERLKGRKAYFYSKNLDKPLEVKSWTTGGFSTLGELDEILEKKGVSPIYKKTYQTEHAGLVSYKQYNLNRDKNQNKE